MREKDGILEIGKGIWGLSKRVGGGRGKEWNDGTGPLLSARASSVNEEETQVIKGEQPLSLRGDHGGFKEVMRSMARAQNWLKILLS